MSQAPSPLVCVGELTAPHGVRGLLRLRSFTGDPAAIFTYALQRDDGAAVKITHRGVVKVFYMVAVGGVDSIDAAQNWRGVKLYTPRDQLPATSDDEYYLSDLLGLTAQLGDGTMIGKVIDTPDFGAGTLLEIRRSGKNSFYIPFTDDFVPRVDVAAGLIEIVMPIEVEGEPR